MPRQRTSVTPKVLEWLNQHANQQVSVSVIAKETGLLTDQVQASLNHLTARTEINLERIIRSQIYILHSNGKAPEKAAKKLFEEIGMAKGDRLIIQDSNGILYEAKEL